MKMELKASELSMMIYSLPFMWIALKTPKKYHSSVLATLVKFYLMEPTVTESQIDTDGYLDDLKYVHNVTNNYNREAFTGSYR